jgi:hypothetical protein
MSTIRDAILTNFKLMPAPWVTLRGYANHAPPYAECCGKIHNILTYLRHRGTFGEVVQ